LKTPVFAVDVGCGNTKFAYREANRAIATGMFPSLAPYTATRTISANNGSHFKTRDVTQVKINAVEYDVGPGVSLSAAYGQTGRVLSDDYVLTNNYTALLAGAIYRSGFTHIKRLVLGLPIHTIEKYTPNLIERFTGEHEFGQGKIVIEKVNVIPQPLGSLTYATALKGEHYTTSQDNLVLDVGYYTTDWVYATDFLIDDRRSGGRPGGASQILQRIADNISRDQKEPIYDIERIDLCRREGQPFHFYDQDIDLMPYLTEAHQLIHDVIMEIKNRVRPLENIRSIILSGGGADLYGPVVQQTFPRTRIEHLQNPCFANSIGYLIAGESADAATQ
jgi:plasmid segregation protein ParM